MLVEWKCDALSCDFEIDGMCDVSGAFHLQRPRGRGGADGAELPASCASIFTPGSYLFENARNKNRQPFHAIPDGDFRRLYSVVRGGFACPSGSRDATGISGGTGRRHARLLNFPGTGPSSRSDRRSSRTGEPEPVFFNAQVYRFVISPVGRVYEIVFPRFVRNRFHDFLPTWHFPSIF